MEKITCECGGKYKPTNKSQHANSDHHGLYMKASYQKITFEDKMEYLMFKINETIDKGDDDDRQMLPRMQDEYDEAKECHEIMVYIMENLKEKRSGICMPKLFMLYDSHKFYFMLFISPRHRKGFHINHSQTIDQIFGRKQKHFRMLSEMRYNKYRVMVHHRDYYFFDNRCLLPSYIKNLQMR